MQSEELGQVQTNIFVCVCLPLKRIGDEKVLMDGFYDDLYDNTSPSGLYQPLFSYSAYKFFDGLLCSTENAFKHRDST